MRFFLESEQPNIPGLTLAESVKPGIRKRHTEAYIVVLIPQPLDHLAARGGGGGGGGGTRSRGFRPSPHLPRAVRHSANRAPPPRVWGGGGGGLSTILLAVGGGGELVSNLWGLGGRASPMCKPRRKPVQGRLLVPPPRAPLAWFLVVTSRSCLPLPRRACAESSGRGSGGLAAARDAEKDDLVIQEAATIEDPKIHLDAGIESSVRACVGLISEGTSC